MSKSKSARRKPLSAANPIDPKLLLRIWRQLDRRNREQVMTAAFGMLRAQVEIENGSRLPVAMRQVLFHSDGRTPFEKVLLCSGGSDVLGALREGTVGRRQRRMRWLADGKLIAPD
jgi:hypothetical protein